MVTPACPDEFERDGEAPVVVITGPTAAGKTACALALARHAPIEVISADSRQVYRGMDIGTAKPSEADRAKLPHHLIDVVPPDQTYSAFKFVRDARRAIADVRRRGRIPVVVGGTGFYIQALLEGSTLGGVPPDPDLRGELRALFERGGAAALVERLRQAAPERMDKLDINNPRRLMRAIELAESSVDGDSRPESPPLAARVLGLRIASGDLGGRIEARVDRMYAAGLLDETRGLLASGYDRGLPAMSGLGYAEAIAHLDGDLTLEAARDRTAARTRQYARRQRTWFRHRGSVHWFPPEAIVGAALDALPPHALRQDV